MNRPLFSPSWHKVASLKPQLLPHACIYRHRYRGQLWYVIQDQIAGRYHRLSPGAHTIVVAMTGERTVQALWDDACATLGDDIPAQDEIVELLAQLHAQDLLQCDVSPDSAEIFERYRKHRRSVWKRRLGNPLSIRIPLLDPDRFLTAWAPHLAWLFSFGGLLLWLVVVVPAVVLAGVYWPELTQNISDRVLSAQNLVVLGLTYPLVKALHELGHGFAIKVWGGEVREMGIMFLVFAPVPYVDASASAAFRSKSQRAVVGAAGMLVELFLAALAMYVWTAAEAGVARAVAFNVMLIAGVSTVVINGNPLLRFDGYYILCDLIEMPNLGQRGQRYCAYLADRYLFGARELEVPHESQREWGWLVGYTVFSWLYRLLVMIAIALFVASEFFFLGVLLALWSVAMFVLVPLGKGVHHVLHSPKLRKARRRALSVSGGGAVLMLWLLLALPMPLRTQSEGVLWLPEDALVRAGANGFLHAFLAEPGAHVASGTPLVASVDPTLAAERALAEAKVAELRARYAAEQFTHLAQAEVLKRQLEQELVKLARVQERVAQLVVYSGVSGQFAVAEPQDLPGIFLKKGELIGYVLDRRSAIARVLVSQDDIDLVRTRLQSVEVRLADRIPVTMPATVMRAVPAGTEQLPTQALSIRGGGKVATDPEDPEGLRTLARGFQFDLRLPQDVVSSTYGGRVYVRFSHGMEPLALQWYRRVRQLFLSRFNV